MKRNKTHLLLLLLLALCLSLFSGCQKSSEGASTAEYLTGSASAASSYRLVESYLGDFSLDFSIDGQMMPMVLDYLYWEHSGDKYEKVLVDEYNYVKAGDVLATFEIGISEADVLEKELAVVAAEAALTEVESRFAVSLASARSAVSGQSGYGYTLASLELQQVESQYAQSLAAANHRLEGAKRDLEELKKRREENSLIAPFDGIVGYALRYYTPGNYVNPDNPIVVLGDMSKRMVTMVNKSPYGSVPYGAKVTLEDLRNQKTYTGTVISCKEVSGRAEDEVVVEVDEKVGADELTGAIRVRGSLIHKENVVLIDKAALKEEGTNYYVRILREGVVRKTYVSVGGINGSVAWITGGLSEGETLVIE